jgi:ring-1,2-phenylacetyl-CoA epoxidase subunit PaaC
MNEETPEGLWAFGTGFDDPLAGVDTAVPPGVDQQDLAAYCAMLGDDALIMSQRLTEWCTRCPELEEELALANIALDLLGQARLLLTRAAKAEGRGRTEDDLAFFRDEQEFGNVWLCEQAGGDFGDVIARLLIFSTWRLALLSRLTGSRDEVIAAIAANGVKEVAYHRDYAARWSVRLGDGTVRSRERMQAALDRAWPFVEELFITHPIEERMAAAGVGTAPGRLRAEFVDVISQVLAEAALSIPDTPAPAPVSGGTGRDGVHTEAMGDLLAQMQSLARAHPQATW